MTRLVWDQSSDRRYESGVSNGVLYPSVGSGVVWNGLISVEKTPIGNEIPQPLYMDGIKYFDNKIDADFKATLEAFSAPSQFGPSDGEQEVVPGFILTSQPRARFGLSYKTFVNAEDYKIHLIYNALAIPDERGQRSNGDSIEVSTFRWALIATPPAVTTSVRPTAYLIVDSRLVDPVDLTTLENNLYGTVSTNPTLPSFDDVYTILGW